MLLVPSLMSYLALFHSGTFVLCLGPKRRRFGHFHDLHADRQGLVGLDARISRERPPPPPHGAATAGLRLLEVVGTSAAVRNVVRFALPNLGRIV